MSTSGSNGSPNQASDETASEDRAEERPSTTRTRSNGGAALVFPVGHYMGPFYPSLDGPAKHHIIRVGWETPKLPDEEHLDVWALAHGLPARIDSVPWTRQAIIHAAEEAEVADAATILDSLADLGVIAEVTPGTDQAREFAESYRLQSLLVGLGNSPDDPILDGIGLIGIPPVVKVRPRVFEIWQWAHLWPTIWGACEGLAYVAAQVEDANPEATDPEKVLDLVFEAMRTLISHNAAYLDVAMTPADEAGSAR